MEVTVQRAHQQVFIIIKGTLRCSTLWFYGDAKQTTCACTCCFYCMITVIKLCTVWGVNMYMLENTVFTALQHFWASVLRKLATRSQVHGSE